MPYPNQCRPPVRRWPVRRSALPLLGLLAGLAAPPRAAAQELVPGTYDPNLENLYPRPVAEEYRRHRVRAVLVMQQAASPQQAGHPLVLSPISYQEFDLQGRATSQYWPQEGRFAYRFDLAYSPASGAMTSATNYHRFADPTDTTRLGLLWLPHSHTAYPPPTTGTGTVATWDERTGDWLLTERSRRWQSHDTTYLTTTKVPAGRLATLERTYYVGAGQRLQRQDKLTYGARGLREAEYTYLRFDKDRVLEIGQLDFEQELANYATAHPDAGPLTTAQMQDDLARHAAGHPQPLATQTYDAHSLVLSRTAVGIRTAYERDAHGQLRQTCHYRGSELWQRASFTYLPNGLVARTTAFDQTGQQTGAFLYRYWYY